MIDEYSRECLAIIIDRHIQGSDVLYCMADWFLMHGIPEHIRSDNGLEFIEKLVRDRPKVTGVKTLFTEPGSPWENGYNVGFNGKLRDEALNAEVFYTLK